MEKSVLAIAAVAIVLLARPACAEWKAVEGGLMTQWAAEVSPENALPEYPRPQLVRADWQNLNGLWDYAIITRDGGKPKAWDGQILVPFCIESALSGVKKAVTPEERLWYRRAFTVPEGWAGRQVLLHFGAVDWECRVIVNGVNCGTHQGGYDPFSMDITHALKPSGEQVIQVAVWDPTDRGYQPRGKQVLEPEGIWYTAVTGIWRTVWLEPVEKTHIESLKMLPDIDAGVLHIEVPAKVALGGEEVNVVALDGGVEVARNTGAANAPLELPIPNAKLWSPDSPFLYDLKVTLTREGKVLDETSSYFGMRKIAVAKDEKGINRLCLNNKPLFQFGPLDQGWWPDGLYTAATDAALRYDVEITRAMGFNMARKHVKVEPDRWYYHCDQLGLMVWQDLPSGDEYIAPGAKDIERGAQSERNYYKELAHMVEKYGNYPCIVMWVPFNEGWGQFETNEVSTWLKALDPSRLVNQASGWTDREGGDVHDMHNYPGPGMFPVEETRASVLGEFGGLGWPVEGHLWWNDRNWGYRTYDTQEKVRTHYAQLVRNTRRLIGDGLCAGVYTQTSDVEGEVNGLLTYDRAMVKMDAAWLKQINDTVYLAPPEARQLAPTSEKEPLRWAYATDAPAAGWEQPGFDDGAWKRGRGAFGTEKTPGAKVRTEWNTPAIWLRRDFAIESLPEGGVVMLQLLHDEDAEIFINGVLAAKVEGYNGGYEEIPISDAARAALKQGDNLFAAHCIQTSGGQSIDVGLIWVKE